MADASWQQALAELIEVLPDSGGLELGRAISELPTRSRRYVSDFGASEFVKRFPQLFTQGKSKSKVMVKLDVPLEFCPQAGEMGGCVKRGCMFLHLCPFFIKENCKFGVKCKRSHNFRDEHTVRVLDHFRLGFLVKTPYFLRSLQRILKLIVDGSEIQRAAASRSVPDICKFYNKATCKKGDKCPCLHVCEHFIDGDCKFGDNCKREHDFSDPHNRKVLEEYSLGDISELKVFKLIANKSEVQLASTSHSVPDICKFYNKAICKKGDSCPCLHVCEHFIDGDCKFGNGCKREHDFSDPHNRKVLTKYSLGDISELKVLQRLKQRERKRPLSGSSDVEKPDGAIPKLANPDAFHTKVQDCKEKETEICGFNLRGKCNYGIKCINRHTELPYLWEFSADGNDKWEAFPSVLNTMLEHAYCDVKRGSCNLAIRGIPYKVQFKDMTAITGLSVAAKYKPPTYTVRRLSTVSSVVAAKGHVFSTKWNWYWQDENQKWQAYDTPDDGHAVNTTSSQCLEKDYLAEEDSHTFSASLHHYTLYFKGMYQRNNKHQTERPVRRRPAEFVTKQNMEEIAQRRRAAIPAHPTTPSATAESDGPPSHWTAIPDGSEYVRVHINTISDEYKKTERKFLETMEGSHHIIRIERVQNPDLWTLYTQRKNRIAKKSGGNQPDERQLFHGTNPETVEAICQQGFDWRMCGKHGTTYGKGSYFACKANYSHRYTATQLLRQGYKRMFLARVVVGSYTTGNSSLTRPPPKDPSNPHVLYDSCCDNVNNPALFVVFENGQSYPEFLITYI